jgi:hypothetical protein
MAERSLERSKFGRLLASYITFHNADPNVLRKVDTIDLVRWLEQIVRMMEAFAAILAADRRGAQKGDRRALVEYLKDLKHPITPDIRAHIIEILSGKQRAANRPPTSATQQGHYAIATFVASRVFFGESYAEAKRRAQEEFSCSDKLIENACDKHGEKVANLVGAIALVRKIAPISNEIMRRGELEHCERAKELLERYVVATDEIAEFGDESDKYPKITALFLSRK